MTGPIDRQPNRDVANEALKTGVLTTLDKRYAIGNDTSIRGAMKQFFERLDRAFDGLANVSGKRILDMPCGSLTSRQSPRLVFEGDRQVILPAPEGYDRSFEPWFCRIVSALGGTAVGIDIGELDTSREDFTYHQVDLGVIGALNFLESGSFDGIQDSRLFGSPEFRAQFPNREDRLVVAEEIKQQEARLLKPEGVIIHTDTQYIF